MKIKSVRFAMLRITKRFENDRAECEVELGPKDKVEDAYALAITNCIAALETNQTAGAKILAELAEGRRWDQLKAICADPAGQAAFKSFIAREESKLRNKRAPYSRQAVEPYYGDDQ